MCIGVSGSIKVSDTGMAALVAYQDFIAFWKSYSFFSFPPMTMGSATNKHNIWLLFTCYDI
jgi:hypothetical protein